MILFACAWSSVARPRGLHRPRRCRHHDGQAIAICGDLRRENERSASGV